MDGIVAGSLVFDEPGGCLFLERDGIRNPVVWPAGASWNPDPGAVALKNRIIEPGMFISGAGGYVSPVHVESAAGSAVAAAAAACADPGGDIALFNAGSEVAVVEE
jgi:hypothetical protein